MKYLLAFGLSLGVGVCLVQAYKTGTALNRLGAGLQVCVNSYRILEQEYGGCAAKLHECEAILMDDAARDNAP